MKKAINPIFQNKHLYFYGSLAFSLTIALVVSLNWPATFDDAFIAMRISRNFIEGNGLYHNLVEKVQTNTSIIAPLLYSPLHLFPVDTSIKLTIIVDLLIVSVSILLFYFSYIDNKTELNIFSKLVISLFPIKIMFSHTLNFGMETQLYILFLALVNYFYLKNRFNIALLIASFGIYLRPEGVLMFGVLSGLVIINFNERKININWKYLKIAMLLSVIPVMYFVLIKLYYGSWIPQTVIAKSVIKVDIINAIITPLNVLFLKPGPSMILNWLILAFIFIKYNKKYNLLTFFIISFSLLFILTGSFHLAFGWYLSPIKLVLSLLTFYILYKLTLVLNKYANIALLILLFGLSIKMIYNEYTYFKNHHTHFRLDMVKKINYVLDNKAYNITTEPLGLLSLYNMNCTFYDFPGLSSKKSSRIVAKEGHIKDINYIVSPNYLALVKSGISEILLLRRTEADAFASELPNYKQLTIIESTRPNNLYLFIDTTKVSSEVTKGIIKRIENLKKQNIKIN